MLDLFLWSSYQMAPCYGVQVLRDSYFWASQVTAVAVTTTARGITSKMLLLGTSADQVSNDIAIAFLCISCLDR